MCDCDLFQNTGTEMKNIPVLVSFFPLNCETETVRHDEGHLTYVMSMNCDYKLLLHEMKLFVFVTKGFHRNSPAS